MKLLLEDGLSRDEQWARLVAALDYIGTKLCADSLMINRVIEVLGVDLVIERELP